MGLFADKCDCCFAVGLLISCACAVVHSYVTLMTTQTVTYLILTARTIIENQTKTIPEVNVSCRLRA